jgi:hypothetical protein
MNLPSGLRIPLAIDASMLIGGLIAIVLMWSDIRSIKADRQQITDGRLVRLEEQNLKSQVQAQWRRRSGP